MVGLLRLKKSSSNLALGNRNVNTPTTPPVPVPAPGPGSMGVPAATPLKGDRWSGEDLVPSDGYSGLFTSGLMHCRNGTVQPATPTSSIPHKSRNRVLTTAPSAFTSNSSSNRAFPSTSTTPYRRRRSSILQTAPTSPAKYKSTAPETSVESAIGRMKILSIASTPSPHKTQQSRWSLSSEETVETVPRKSGESVRSKFSLKSRKSEERERDRGRPALEELMQVDQEEVPPVPKMPYTPRRMNALRRFLTPKKKQAGLPPTPAPSYAPPIPMPTSQRPPMPFTPSTKANLPANPGERTLPKKGSFASLKSLAKKGSSTTLRGLFRDDAEPIPSLPPNTPSRQHLRPAKSSIGPPTALPAASPSAFLQEMPRRAPTTPRKETDSVLADLMDFEFHDTPEMSFSNTPGSAQANSSIGTSIFTPSFGGSTMSLTSTPSMTPLTAKAQRARPGKGPLSHFLPPSARLNHGLGPLVAGKKGGSASATMPDTPDSASSSYAIISSYTRASMGPSNTTPSATSGSKSYNLFKAVVSKQPSSLTPIRSHSPASNPWSKPSRLSNEIEVDSATFGRRSAAGSRAEGVDFTASPGKKAASVSKHNKTSMASMSSSSGSSSSSMDGLNDSFEFEKYLSGIEAREVREAREAMFVNRI